MNGKFKVIAFAVKLFGVTEGTSINRLKSTIKYTKLYAYHLHNQKLRTVHNL